MFVHEKNKNKTGHHFACTHIHIRFSILRMLNLIYSTGQEWDIYAFLRISISFLPIFYRFVVDLLWMIYGLVMGFLMDFLRSATASMWVMCALAMGVYGYLRDFIGFSLGFMWNFYGVSMGHQ